MRNKRDSKYNYHKHIIFMMIMILFNSLVLSLTIFGYSFKKTVSREFLESIENTHVMLTINFHCSTSGGFINQAPFYGENNFMSIFERSFYKKNSHVLTYGDICHSSSKSCRSKNHIGYAILLLARDTKVPLEEVYCIVGTCSNYSKHLQEALFFIERAESKNFSAFAASIEDFMENADFFVVNIKQIFRPVRLRITEYIEEYNYRKYQIKPHY